MAARAAARAAAQATLAKKYAYEQELKRREARMLHLMRERAQAGAAGADLVAFDGGGVSPRGPQMIESPLGACRTVRSLLAGRRTAADRERPWSRDGDAFRIHSIAAAGHQPSTPGCP